MADKIKSGDDFLSIYNDLEKYHTLADVAAFLGISIKTVRNKAAVIRGLSKSDPRMPKIILRACHSEAPMSEDSSRFHDEWTADDCLDELRRISEIDVEQIVTRNYFRNHSKISEATWNRYFGTFEEFKRQAGVKLSRQQHAHERNIAKHASVDHYRQVSIERQDYADKYIRENSNRFKTILTCSDLHDIEIDPFYLRVLIDTARRVQPDVICFVGDVFDLAEFGKYLVDPREWDVVGRIKFVHEKIFAPLREACPDSQFDLIEGNHEARMIRQLADATPALRSVLADLHGFTASKLLGLNDFDINYIAKADLAAWTKREQEKELANNYKIYWETVVCHHFPHARNMGLAGVNGHHHKHQVWSAFNPIYGPYEWHQLGSGHRRSASYCEGERWNNGFALINVDTKKRSTNFDYVTVTDFAISGGKWYHRNKDES
jgi:predicted MPP superfamily phosphohydrolase